MSKLFTVGAALLLWLVACQSAPIVELASAPLIDEPALHAAPTQTPAKALITVRQKSPPPLIRVIEPTATPLPAVQPPSAGELATATPTAEPSPTPVPSATSTPLPTFTPPALPGTSANEHYWLRRPIADGGIVWTDKVYPYGSTRSGTLRPHHGVEFNVPPGTPILAAAAGTVAVAGNDSATAYGPTTDFYGNLVVIEHETGYRGRPVYSLYGHLSQVNVVPGQQVAAQQLIGYSGSSGVADGPHLHFEVRVGSNSYDATRTPTLWLYPFRDHGTIAGRVTFSNGSLAEGAPISVTRVDAPSPYKGTTSYSGGTVIADDGWRENFVVDDVKAGYYTVAVKVGQKRYKTETWVYPYQTSFVEIVIDLPAD